MSPSCKSFKAVVSVKEDMLCLVKALWCGCIASAKICMICGRRTVGANVAAGTHRASTRVITFTIRGMSARVGAQVERPHTTVRTCSRIKSLRWLYCASGGGDVGGLKVCDRVVGYVCGGCAGGMWSGVDGIGGGKALFKESLGVC